MLQQLLPGLLVTIKLTLSSAVVALVCAFLSGLGLLSRHTVIRWPARTYVEVFRGTSAVVQLFWLYFALPQFGIRLGAFEAAVIGLGLNVGAYGAEVVRACIAAIPSHQSEGAAALGLTKVQTFRVVTLPQALRAMLPPFGNMAIELLKLSSIVSLVSIGDLTLLAASINATTLKTIEVFGLVLAIYFAMSSIIGGGFRLAERALMIPGQGAPRGL